ncbi:MAG: lipoprotein [Chlamydiia bacterium]|nr:lipoprotein [Chlamydiia bacterium]
MKKLILAFFALASLTACSRSDSISETPDCSCGHTFCECEAGCACQCNG